MTDNSPNRLRSLQTEGFKVKTRAKSVQSTRMARMRLDGMSSIPMELARAMAKQGLLLALGLVGREQSQVSVQPHHNTQV
jgi:hypothetical protein